MERKTVLEILNAVYKYEERRSQGGEDFDSKLNYNELENDLSDILSDYVGDNVTN